MSTDQNSLDLSSNQQYHSLPVTTEHDASEEAPEYDPEISFDDPSSGWNAIVNTVDPVDKANKIEKQLTHQPWNIELWNIYLKESLELKNPDLIRTGFKKFLDKFPTSSSVWIQWIRFEERHQAYDEMEKLFNQCLRSAMSVDLCRYYLGYIRERQNAKPASTLEEKRAVKETISKAFEFVLSQIGTDKESGPIYQDYIEYIKTSEALSTYEEQQKMDTLRRIYQRAVHIPLTNIEQLWKEYDSFENTLNKLTAKKIIAEKAAGYMTARAALKDMKTLLEPIEKLQRKWLSTPPSWIDREIHLLNAWKRYIAWETSNPLHLEDIAASSARVTYAYRSAIQMLRYHPEIWYDGCKFIKKCGKMEDAVSFIQMGCELNPTSILLAFTHAELEEEKKSEYIVLQTIFDTLISKLEEQYNETNAFYDQERDSLLKMLQESDEQTLRATQDKAEDEEVEWDGELREKEREMQKEREREVNLRIESKRKQKLHDIKSALSLSWITYMRFARRSQGIKAARQVFGRARKSPLVTYHVYVASALMEFYVNKDGVVASKIFELGMKTFSLTDDEGSADFVSHYLDFLLGLNDDNNTRALFERALSALPSSVSERIWDKYFDYENQYGDLGSLHKVLERREALFPKENLNTISWIHHVASKWNYFDLDSISRVELGYPALKHFKRKAPPALTAKPGGHSSMLGTSIRSERPGRQMSQALVSVNPNDYPRPEFSKWEMHRPEPGQALVLNLDLPAETQQAPQDTFTPQSDIPSSEQTQEPEIQLMIPEPIAALMTALPGRDVFPGPDVNVDELLAIVVNLQIPLPAAQPNMVPISSSARPDSPAMRFSSRTGGRGNDPYRSGSGGAYKRGYRRDDDFRPNKIHRRD